MFARTITAFTLALAGPLAAQQTAAPEGAEVYFVEPADGATVSSPVRVVFGLSGMGVAPAGTEADGTGHHHLLIDRPPFGEGAEGETSEPLPADDNHVHFGGGQTETSVELEPGDHTLQLVLGDWSHIPHDPPVTSEVITITVE
ncbi:hypothetical protein ROJ8625_00567 [Roseivivax jejudonensis]|uniref:DUF4399 domain-containing protein n=1 Tax=Roseivivax jejudonensis TaxID=1529041 RepID=A0A1X6YDS7_9RHOB|nr:DUF4399 domain-containing protein [Roseivivax jejudonensis]SLN17602.1 hypothetical protein ROJ8625_00567 [Roseivivax jejudonensis]